MGRENDVYKLRGIGPKYAQLLEEVGVDSIKELRRRNAASLKSMIETRHGSVAGLSLSRVQGWIDQAKVWDVGAVPMPQETGAAEAEIAASSNVTEEVEAAPSTADIAESGPPPRARFRYLPDTEEPHVDGSSPEEIRPVAAATEAPGEAPAPAPRGRRSSKRGRPTDADDEALPAAAASSEPQPPSPDTPRSLPDINESLVRAMFDAWAACDEEMLDRLVATDVVFRIAGEEPYVGREAVFSRWDRQDELLEDVAYEAELRDLSATDVNVFTYVETWGKVPESGQSFNYTTVTVYRIREGQIVEVRPHVHDLDAYEEFWSSLARGPGVGPAGVPGGGYSPSQSSTPPRHPGGFQRFRLY